MTPERSQVDHHKKGDPGIVHIRKEMLDALSEENKRMKAALDRIHNSGKRNCRDCFEEVTCYTACWSAEVAHRGLFGEGGGK